MKCSLMTAALAACFLSVQGALAANRDLAEGEIQGLGDVTAGFHSPEQRSTINSITNIPGGVELDVTFRIGNGDCDPLFGCGPGQPFADFSRVSTSAFFNGQNPRQDFASFDGFSVTVESSVEDVFVQPFIQTSPDWTFYEQSDGGDTIPAATPTSVALDFSDAQNFSGLLPANEVHEDANGRILANALGYQFLYNGTLVFGDTDTPDTAVNATIRITGTGIPEPATGLLIALLMSCCSLLRLRR